MLRSLVLLATVVFSTPLAQAQKKLVLIDQDGAGPGGTDQMSIMLLAQSPEVELLGITIVVGDCGRDEGVTRTLRMLEIIGKRVPVAAGASAPLIRTEEETRRAASVYGKAEYLGAWQERKIGSAAPRVLGPHEIPPLEEGAPTTKPVAENAAAFLIRQIRAHPGDVSLYAAGPMTNIATALAVDPEIATLAREIVIMGGAIRPVTDDPEFIINPQREFNFWFDPEAARIVLRAPWQKISVSTVDISVKAPFTRAILEQIAKSKTPGAQYIAKWSEPRSYLWDELAAAAILDSSLITKQRSIYMDVDLSHGPGYGNTLTWREGTQPVSVRKVIAFEDVDLARFVKLFIERVSK
jgi:inosine-uridine nucleoside N-ribohydrolase